MAELYRDRWIRCTDDGITVRGYYVPWGSKRIRYDAIRAMRRVEIGALTGRGRIWGTANPRYWAHLDPRRPKKRTALILDVGGFVRPVLTPDDPDAVEAAIRAHTDLPPATGERAPLL